MNGNPPPSYLDHVAGCAAIRIGYLGRPVPTERLSLRIGAVGLVSPRDRTSFTAPCAGRARARSTARRASPPSLAARVSACGNDRLAAGRRRRPVWSSGAIDARCRSASCAGQPDRVRRLTRGPAGTPACERPVRPVSRADDSCRPRSRSPTQHRLFARAAGVPISVGGCAAGVDDAALARGGVVVACPGGAGVGGAPC